MKVKNIFMDQQGYFPCTEIVGSLSIISIGILVIYMKRDCPQILAKISTVKYGEYALIIILILLGIFILHEIRDKKKRNDHFIQETLSSNIKLYELLQEVNVNEVIEHLKKENVSFENYIDDIPVFKKYYCKAQLLSKEKIQKENTADYIIALDSFPAVSFLTLLNKATQTEYEFEDFSLSFWLNTYLAQELIQEFSKIEIVTECLFNLFFESKYGKENEKIVFKS